MDPRDTGLDAWLYIGFAEDDEGEGTRGDEYFCSIHLSDMKPGTRERCSHLSGPRRGEP